MQNPTPAQEGVGLLMMTRTAIHPLKILAAVGAAFVLWGLLLAYASSPADADPTFIVNSTGDQNDIDFPGGTFDEPSDAKCDVDSTLEGDQCTLRAAIQEANVTAGNDTIDIGVTGTVNLAEVLPDLSSNIEIVGPGADQFTVRRADTGEDFRIFHVTGDTSVVTISGITISNGNVPSDSGGGILNADAGTVKVTDSTISGNSARFGGGIYNADAGTVKVTDSTISGDNTAHFDGGGINNDGDGPLKVSGSTISGNSAGFNGGGILNDDAGTLTVTDSTISDNTARFGGGINNDGDGPLKVTDSTISGNSASAGGGIYQEDAGSLTVSGSTISDNTAFDEGGGIYSLTEFPDDDPDNDPDTSTTITNSTISGNSAESEGVVGAAGGGGVLNVSGLTVIEFSTITNNTAPNGQGSGVASLGDNFTPTEVHSSIISANQGTDVDFVLGDDNSFVSNGYNLIGDDGNDGNATGAFNNTGDQVATVNNNINAMVGPLVDNGGPTLTHALEEGSPAIDAIPVDANGCGTDFVTDQRGVERPQGEACDMGAFELNLIVNNDEDTPAANDGECTTDPGGCTLREAIDDANASTGADTITFNLGPSATITLDSALPNITDTAGLTIEGGSADITISGDNQVRVFFVDGGNLTLNKLTVANGYADGENPGDEFGGGAFNDGGTLTISNSTFSHNHAFTFGGGVYTTEQGTVIVTDSTFSDNSARSGGGIYNENSSTTVTNSTFSGNSAFDDGGGIFNNFRGTLTVTNSTFSGNSAENFGGGIFSAGGTATLKNTIVANSTSGGDCDGATDSGYNLIEDGSCLTAGTTSISGDPNLGPLADNGGPTQTHALLAGSSAVDAIPDGTNGCATDITQDQRGVRRPQGSACDLGAFELDQPPIVTINQASGQADTTTDSPIHFTAEFNEPVTGFTDSDVTLSGTAGATTADVTEIAPNDGTTYDVAVSGMTSDGTVIASIPANSAQDADQNGNTASTSTDNTVDFDAPNISPTAVDDSYTTNEDTLLTGNVLANDSDPDSGDTLKAALVSDPAHGTLDLNDDGSFSYTPNANYNDPDSFTYKASDGNGGEDTATVSITVTPVNDAPSFTKGADQTVAEDSGPHSVSNWASAISAGPADESSQGLSFVVTNNTGLFSAGPAVSANGTLTYTLASDKYGSADITVKLKDDGGTPNDTSDDAESATQTFKMTVTSVNDPPKVEVAAATSCGTNDRSGTITLSVSDVDSPVAGLTLSATDTTNTNLVPTSNVTFGGSGASRTLTAAALSGKTGTAVLTVTVTDGQRVKGAPLTVNVRVGGNGNNTLVGDANSDILLGQNGDDTLRGDPLTGVGGKDLICGGRGNDRLSGGGDADRFEGGSGNDRATDFTPSEGDTKDNTVETF
jgi:hypothetical protein